jgi:3'(2'), 5'-bisphosphate nucleotidase
MLDVTQELLGELVVLAHAAGEAILEVYGRDFEVRQKEDASPITEADLAANAVILAGLSQVAPSVPAISEESSTVPFAERSAWREFWLVDPVDGTKEFLKKNGEFTVNVALVQDGRPVAGVVHAPALGRTFVGAQGLGAWQAGTAWEPIAAAPFETGTLRVVASRSHAGPETRQLLQDLSDRHGELETVSMGSSLKLCLVADGSAHLYPRLGPTMWWDTAAAHAVALASGASVRDMQGNDLRYEGESLLNPFFVVAAPGVQLP